MLSAFSSRFWAGTGGPHGGAPPQSSASVTAVSSTTVAAFGGEEGGGGANAGLVVVSGAGVSCPAFVQLARTTSKESIHRIIDPT